MSDTSTYGRLASALGHPTRIRLLAALSYGALRPREVAELLDVDMAHIGRVLGRMRQHGIVACYRVGSRSYYHLTPWAQQSGLAAFVAGLPREAQDG